MKKIIILLIISILYSCNYRIVSKKRDKNPCEKTKTIFKEKQYTYSELLNKVANYEATNKDDFIKIQTSYRKQLFTGKLIYFFNIKNSAKVIIFKDAKFLVSLISETGTVMKKDTIYAYKFFPPGKTVQYKYVTSDIYHNPVTVKFKYLGISVAK